MATVTVTGNVNNPELRFTPSGDPVLSFSLAENHRKKSGNEWIDDGTTWRRVSVWRDAESLSNVLTKGARVIVVGEERLREYEGKNGKGVTLELNAKWVGIVPARDKQQQPANDAWTNQAPANDWPTNNEEVPF